MGGLKKTIPKRDADAPRHEGWPAHTVVSLKEALLPHRRRCRHHVCAVPVLRLLHPPIRVTPHLSPTLVTPPCCEVVCFTANVGQVIHYEYPKFSETFAHRTGRTGQAGKKGSAILIHSSHQYRDVKGVGREVGCRFIEECRGLNLHFCIDSGAKEFPEYDIGSCSGQNNKEDCAEVAMPGLQTCFPIPYQEIDASILRSVATRRAKELPCSKCPVLKLNSYLGCLEFVRLMLLP
ncbi:uncharacterized protein LOC127239258 [Andrographis paniculata]|uniref:uncharacterized protein LOC127239258 n=1 Tax=Andrographis paniculata TaxID=175694 RepID=UPI0021E95C70|nr:uncharacterized protein LOC127239258 [Andrographis paniculata]